MNHIEGTLFIALLSWKFVGPVRNKALPILEEITEIDN